MPFLSDRMSTPMTKDDNEEESDIDLCETCDGCDNCNDCVCNQTLVGCSKCRLMNYLCYQCHVICPVCHDSFCHECFTHHVKTVHTLEQQQKAKDEHVKTAHELTERAKQLCLSPSSSLSSN